MKKIIMIITAVAVAIVPLSAFAGWPATDVGNAVTHAGNLVTNSNTTAQQVLKTLKDYGLDQVAYTLAQKLGQKMATAAINKATGGASRDKDPNFVSNFGQEVSKLEEQSLDIFTTKLSTSSNPNARGIAAGMRGLSDSELLPTFTLGSVLSNNGDFSAIGANAQDQFSFGVGTGSQDWKSVANDISLAGDKGWDFYAQVAFPQNTPIGSGMIAQDNLARQIQQEKKTQQLKLTSSGFLPNSKCTLTASDFKQNIQSIQGSTQGIRAENYNIAALQSQLDAARAAQTQAIATYGDNSPEANAADEAYYNAETQLNAAISANQGAIQANGVNIGTNSMAISQDVAGCVEEMIKNPIATTQTLTNEAGKFGMDMTKNIQGWGQIVAGLFVSLFNGFVNEGLGQLKADYGKVKQSNTGGPEQLAQNQGGSINFANAPYNIVDLRNDFEESILATRKNIAALENVQKWLLKTPSRLAMLDMCLPGPDIIGLNKRLEKYYDQQTGWIQKTSIMGDDKKRNTDQEFVLAMLERDYDLSKAEMTRVMMDDTRNIPGASAMRTMIGTFQNKKNAYQKALDDLDNASQALSQLRTINTELKETVIKLKEIESGFASLPDLIFTNEEWAGTDASVRDSVYNWLVQNSDVAPDPDPLLSDDENRRAYVIKGSWDVWEYPNRFLPDDKWSDQDADGTSLHATNFLAVKNEVRASYAAIKDIVSTDWEISKNQQLYGAIVNDITKTDEMIHDCDKMRQLIWGEQDGYDAPYNGKSNQEMLADMFQNKDTYFRSQDIKTALTLPNVLNTPRTWAEDGCIPDDEINYQATQSSGINFGAHTTGPGGEKYTCLGDFGHTYGGIESESNYVDFNYWIDQGSNAYQTITHIQWPSELWLGSRILRFIPPPDPDPYDQGWRTEVIHNWNSDDSQMEVPDSGGRRNLFCRLSSVHSAYGLRSGADVPHPAKGIYCSSKWADVSIAEAVGLFVIDTL